MTKKEWLEEQIMCDEWGRPPSLRCSINNYDKKRTLLKQGGDEKSINELYKETFNVKESN